MTSASRLSQSAADVTPSFTGRENDDDGRTMNEEVRMKHERDTPCSPSPAALGQRAAMRVRRTDVPDVEDIRFLHHHLELTYRLPFLQWRAVARG
jgi:hypothetical protein